MSEMAFTRMAAETKFEEWLSDGETWMGCFENAAMEYDEANERPTYQLALGRPGRSRALEIASRMGIARDVLSRAEGLLGGEHLKLDRWLRRLETLEQGLIEERSTLAMRESQIERLRLDAGAELARLEKERALLPVELKAERERLRLRAKQQLDRATAKLEKATKDLKPMGRRSIQKLRDEALDLGVQPRPESTAEPEGPQIGARVRLVGLGGEGEIQAVRGSQVAVVIGNKRVWAPITDVEILRRGKSAPNKRVVHIEVTEEAPQELMLIGFDSERAREDLERALDQAFAAGKRMIRIVHGHGTGTLRRMVADVCREHPAVKSFKHPPGNRGGTGATEVEIEESG
jgi:DNA mismatch repair protein MutS2